MGAAFLTARTTSSYCCGPVTDRTLGNCSFIIGSLPIHPVTITRPFSNRASSIAERLSAFAEFKKPHVLTIIASESS